MKGAIEGEDARRYAEHGSERSKEFDDFILKHARGRVLDLACGPGNTLALFDEATGVDVSGEMVRICTERFANKPGVRLIKASATSVPLDEDFDTVVMRMGLHHIEEKGAALDEAKRLLSPGGRFILIDKHTTPGSEPHEAMLSFEENLRLVEERFRIAVLERDGKHFLMVLHKL